MTNRENKDGSYNVRGYGGARPGSGPKPTGRKPHSFYITEIESIYLKQMLENIRKPDITLSMYNGIVIAKIKN